MYREATIYQKFVCSSPGLLRKIFSSSASFAILIALYGCLEPIEPETVGFDDLLVVEGLITDRPVKQKVTLSRTIPLGGEDTIRRMEEDATVWIVDQSGNTIDFFEEEQGIYMTRDAYAGEIGGTFQLFIQTINGNNYESEVVSMLPTPPVDSIYAEFEPSPTSGNARGGFFNFFIDARNNPQQNQYYRWTWNSTFELTVPNPSRWLWIGGNDVIIREVGSENDDLQVELCWNTEYGTSVILQELLIPSAGVIKLPILSFHSDSRRMRIGYSLEVKQYALSRASFEYWNAIAESTQEQGSLFDTQVGTITGNIRNVNDDREIVLGIFEASQEMSLRRQYHPLEFGKAGFSRISTNFVQCSDIEPIISGVDEIGKTMEERGDAVILTFFVTAPPSAYYYPPICADCTLYGDNKRPSFWE